MTSELKNWLAKRDFDVEDVCESDEFCWVEKMILSI